MNLKAYLPTILAAIGAVIPSVSSDVAAAIGVFVQHNPALSSWLVMILWVIYHFLPSPIQSQVTSNTMPKA